MAAFEKESSNFKEIPHAYVEYSQNSEKKGHNYRIITDLSENSLEICNNFSKTSDKKILNFKKIRQSNINNSFVDTRNDTFSPAFNLQRLTPDYGKRLFRKRYVKSTTSNYEKFIIGYLRESKKSIENLGQSLQKLNKQLSVNEEIIKETISSNESIKDKIKHLEVRIESANTCAIERKSQKLGCNCLLF